MTPRLPIHDLIPDLLRTLEAERTVIIHAPPGAGKSTVLPLELLRASWLGAQKVIMLEPRRLAARGVASRMAALLNEPVGRTVGYRVRFERVVSAQTQLEVLTEGLLTRRLQDDAALTGVGVVIFDEFHERSLNADLALALCREVQAALRDDLRLIVMSATLDGDELSRKLGNASVLRASGQTFPVEVQYSPRASDLPIETLVTRSVRQALETHEGDVLAFLPGQREIHRTLAALQDESALVLPLYGELPLEAQAQAIQPDPQGRRKVVLATSIAETSLTIEGVRTVVDSGLARVPRFDPNTALSRLETVRVTRDAADQRAGRAGRVAPGTVYRLWTASTQAGLQAQRPPEILEADLAPLMLELAAWGSGTLEWVTPPPVGAMNQAKSLLEGLGALESGRITPRGREMLRFPAHPRLAHLLLEAKHRGWGSLAADVAAVLEERDFLLDAGVDIVDRVEALRNARARRGTPGADGKRLERAERVSGEWRRLLEVPANLEPVNARAVGLLVALAYPDRIAQQRPGEVRRYRLAGGRGVRLPDDDDLAGQDWLAVAALDAGSSEGRVQLAASLDPADLLEFVHEADSVRWDDREGTIKAQRERRIGELVLEARSIEVSDTERLRVLMGAVREGKLELPWTEAARQTQARIQSLRLWRPDTEIPDSSDQALLDTLETWLGSVRRRDDLARLNLETMLEQRLGWAGQQQLETLAPKKISVPSGSQIKLEYTDDGRSPVLAVRLQEVFGWQVTPTVCDGRVPVVMHLLSPAYRPVQVTQDLASFWQNVYPSVRKELRIKYPKHSWPDDPLRAEAVRGVKRRPISS